MAFKDKDHQRSTIKCGIREVLGNQLSLSSEIKNLLLKIIQVIDGKYLQG